MIDERIEPMAKAMAEDDAEKAWDDLTDGGREWYRNLAKAALRGIVAAGYKIVRVNFAPSAPWYRRFAFGDPYPNTFAWKVFDAEVRGAWVLIERHTRECECSYCRGEHGHGLLWLPADRKRGWRVLNFWHRLYVRWVSLSRHKEPRYSKEANYQVPPSGR